LKRVPISFQNVEEYVQIFQPLLLEEARAIIQRDWEESGKNNPLIVLVYICFLVRK
jgi:hypothetical protein